MQSLVFPQMNPYLLIGGLLSFLASGLHIACIIGGANWLRFFGAGEQLAQMAERGVMVSRTCDIIHWRGAYGLGHVRTDGGGNTKRGGCSAGASFFKMDIGSDYGCVCIARSGTVYRRYI